MFGVYYTGTREFGFGRAGGDFTTMSNGPPTLTSQKSMVVRAYGV